MARDPQVRVKGEGARPERPSALRPEEYAEPAPMQNADPDWLSMATADPALFLKDPDVE